MKKEVKLEMAEWIYEYAKEKVHSIGIHYQDVTAKIFVDLLDELDKDLADKLYKYYNG